MIRLFLTFLLATIAVMTPTVEAFNPFKMATHIWWTPWRMFVHWLKTSKWIPKYFDGSGENML